MRSHAPAKAGDIRISLNAFVFFKDNEYFNKIVDGYTLYGTQLNPQLVYYPIKDLRLEGGVFLWKDFGNPVLQQVRPTFRATWTTGKQQIILGNIRPHLAHNYIEPMFNFERAMLNPLEEGIQVRYQGTRLFVDQWVDWQRQQYRYSNYQEEVAGGISSNYRLSRDGSPWEVAVPFQFTAIHHGGQIDTLDKPLQTVFNEALGLEARHRLAGPTVQAVRLNGYVLGYQDYSFTKGQFPFRYGRALYLNATLETRYADVMLSYWQGSRFISPLGGDLYQSASRTVSNPDFVDPKRKIVMLRLLHDFRISDAASLTARVEPLFDLNAKLLDYSFGMYLNFRQDWLLGNAAKRVRVAQ
ncbi:hypothetical protein Q3A66_00565 [Hymenobacter sp. BT770]|uniref:hypothetical protein n=1 Tax=Hymenobacter sp. BT770 TaxID=2886942 RepID=UPI001D1298BD|nr:hypothetical protein [Hymenobacter sp. BT770]MCC3151838.1 hypothetical protein [Hymenobacter sp. BT770]MDO3413540.1 hypothetical protein [Hymenobacter sp. BT770]